MAIDLTINRTRERSEFAPTSISCTRTTNGNSYTQTITQPFNTGGSRTCYDTPHDDYAARSAQGEVIMSDFLSVREKHDSESFLNRAGEIRYKNNNSIASQSTGYISTFKGSGVVGPPACPSVEISFPDLESMVNQAVTRVWAKRHESEAELLVSIAEARKTARYLHNVVRRAIPHLKRAKNLKVAVARGAVTATYAAQAWLEVRYGLMPLIYDVQSYIGAYNNRQKTHRSRLIANVNARKDEVDVTPWGFSSVCDYNVTKTLTSTVDVSAGLLIDWKTDLISISENLGTARFLSMAWEIVPFSFIVDWFFNTAQFIASWEPMFYGSTSGCWTTIRYTLDETWITGDFYSIPSATYYSTFVALEPAHYRRAYNSVHRLVNRNRPVLPAVNVRMNAAKWTDIIAILWGYKDFFRH